MDHCEITEKTVSHAHNFHGCHQNLQYIENVTGDEWRMKDGEVFAQKRFHQNYKNMILVITWSSSKQYAKIKKKIFVLMN